MRSILVVTTIAMMMASSASAWVSPPLKKWHVTHYENMMTATPSSASTSPLPGLQMTSSEDDVSTKPTTFREAEVLGLRLMQEGQFDAALKGKARWITVQVDASLFPEVYTGVRQNRAIASVCSTSLYCFSISTYYH